MKPSKLLKSTMILAAFYMALAMVLFTLTPPMTVYRLIEELPAPMALRLGDIPSREDINILDQGPLQIALMRAWTIPVVLAWIASCLLGLLTARALVALRAAFGRRHIRSREGYGELNCTVGQLPTPVVPKSELRSVNVTGVPMTDGERKLLERVIGVLAANRDIFAGAGHGVRIYQHTLNVLNRVLSQDDVNGQKLIVAAAHDLGKITKAGTDAAGDDYLVFGHAQESSRILACLPEFRGLPPDDAERIRLAVKYEHCEGALPKVRQPTRASVLELIKSLRKADGLATADEKQVNAQALVPDEQRPTFAYERFLTMFPQMPLRTRSAPQGSSAGFKKGNRLYLMEIEVREILERAIDSETYAALSVGYRKSGTKHPFTTALLQGLHENGWLVTRHAVSAMEAVTEHECAPELALWDIRSGKAEFNGIIIVDVPAQWRDRLPDDDTDYDIEVLRQNVVCDAPELSTPSKPVAAVDDAVETQLFDTPGKKSKAPPKKRKSLDIAVEQGVSIDPSVITIVAEGGKGGT